MAATRTRTRAALLSMRTSFLVLNAPEEKKFTMSRKKPTRGKKRTHPVRGRARKNRRSVFRPPVNVKRLHSTGAVRNEA